MAVLFKMIPKKNMLVSPPVVKYYPVAISDGEADFDYLCKRVAQRSTVSAADCYGALVALTEVIGEELLDGKIVSLDRLGSFKLTLKGTPADTAHELGKSNVIGAKVVYKPSKIMKKTIGSARFKRLR
jgi:predicted histone-like DNA-binding protein